MNSPTHPIALVTGANKGIGLEIARQLLERGCTVYVGSRRAESADQAVRVLGGDTRPLLLDVTDPAGIAAAAQRLEVLDVLVNNAGVSPAQPLPAQDEEVETFRRVFETNVFGVVAVTNAFVPALRRSGRARIVNVSSGTASLTWSSSGPMASYQGGYASYRASKTALNALTVFYAQSLAADGIKVNALAPGLRRTDLNSTAAATGGDPAEAAAGAVRLALLPEDGPTGGFFNWDATPVPW